MLLVATAMISGCSGTDPKAPTRQEAIEAIKKLDCTVTASDARLVVIAKAEFGDADLAKLPEFVTKEFFNSVSLTLTGSKVTGAGLKHLEKIPNIETLILVGLPATDDSLKHLAPMKKSLTDLELHGTKITDPGLKHLEVLTALEYLTLPNNITDPAIAELKKKLPNLEDVEKLPPPDKENS
jgi:hypothetical protein